MAQIQLKAALAGRIELGRERIVNRLGFGAMRITGPGIWGEPRDPDEARRVLRRALELGVEARLGSGVIAIQPDPAGGGTLATASGERLACGRILIAAGPWTRPLALQAGADLPLTVERHIVVTFR